ncbi:MAG: DUF5681 domain-containing protein [Planctomycetota bacterium]
MKKTLTPRQQTCLFKRGNQAGVATRFQPGQSGNPRGRPPKVSTCLRWMRHPKITTAVLHAVVERSDFRSTEKAAAHQLLVEYYLPRPFRYAEECETHRVYRQWYAVRDVYLKQVLVDRREPFERREAARRRLNASG